MTRSELNNTILLVMGIIIGLLILLVLFYLFKTIKHNKNIDIASGKYNKKNNENKEVKSVFKLDNVSLKFKELSENELIVENPIDDHNLNFFDDFENRTYEDFYVDSNGKVVNGKKSFKDFRKL